MSASAREVIVTAAADCPQVLIRGDVYELGDTIIAALSAAGLKLMSEHDLALAHDTAFLKGIRAGAKFGVIDTPAYDSAVRVFEVQMAAAEGKK